MSEQLRESLSAAMDNEADAFELRRVLDEAKGDAELREEWQRFHLIRDLMQKSPQNYAPGLRDAIWDELMAEDSEDVAEGDIIELSPDQRATPSSNSSRWGMVGAAGVAATVALMVVLYGNVLDEEPTVELAEPAYAPQGTMQAASAPVTAADRQRRNAYYLRHTQLKAMNQIGVASFTKIVTFDREDMAAGEVEREEAQAKTE